jgi:membrane protease YdiL (CAAX protease family)
VSNASAYPSPRLGLLLWLAGLPGRVHERPPGAIVWVAIIGSAILFGVGHLPAATAMVGNLSAAAVGLIIGSNAAFGIVAGYLFWRWGLEAAMIAHVLAHVFSVVLSA